MKQFQCKCNNFPVIKRNFITLHFVDIRMSEIYVMSTCTWEFGFKIGVANQKSESKPYKDACVPFLSKSLPFQYCVTGWKGFMVSPNKYGIFPPGRVCGIAGHINKVLSIYKSFIY